MLSRGTVTASFSHTDVLACSGKESSLSQIARNKVLLSNRHEDIHKRLLFPFLTDLNL